MKTQSIPAKARIYIPKIAVPSGAAFSTIRLLYVIRRDIPDKLEFEILKITGIRQ